MSARSIRSGVVVLSLIACVLASCDGGDETSASAASGSGSSGVSTSPDAAWTGLWVDDKRTYLFFQEDGRFAKLSSVDSATQDLRLYETGENEYGETTIWPLNKKAGWQVEGDALVSYKRPFDPELKHERIAGRTFHRASREERFAFWNASAWRLVREGRMKEILEAEAAGFDFSKIVDSSIDVARPGQNVHVDMASYAREKGQPEIADHFDEKYGPYRK